jgi:hypothetical protein
VHLSPAQVQKRLVHRADDNLEAIQARIAQYKANVNAVRGYFRLPLYLRARERESARAREREFNRNDTPGRGPGRLPLTGPHHVTPYIAYARGITSELDGVGDKRVIAEKIAQIIKESR